MQSLTTLTYSLLSSFASAENTLSMAEELSLRTRLRNLTVDMKKVVEDFKVNNITEAAQKEAGKFLDEVQTHINNYSTTGEQKHVDNHSTTGGEKKFKDLNEAIDKLTEEKFVKEFSEKKNLYYSTEAFDASSKSKLEKEIAEYKSEMKKFFERQLNSNPTMTNSKISPEQKLNETIFDVSKLNEDQNNIVTSLKNLASFELGTQLKEISDLLEKKIGDDEGSIKKEVHEKFNELSGDLVAKHAAFVKTFGFNPVQNQNTGEGNVVSQDLKEAIAIVKTSVQMVNASFQTFKGYLKGDILAEGDLKNKYDLFNTDFGSKLTCNGISHYYLSANSETFDKLITDSVYLTNMKKLKTNITEILDEYKTNYKSIEEKLSKSEEYEERIVLKWAISKKIEDYLMAIAEYASEYEKTSLIRQEDFLEIYHEIFELLNANGFSDKKYSSDEQKTQKKGLSNKTWFTIAILSLAVLVAGLFVFLIIKKQN